MTPLHIFNLHILVTLVKFLTFCLTLHSGNLWTLLLDVIIKIQLNIHAIRLNFILLMFAVNHVKPTLKPMLNMTLSDTIFSEEIDKKRQVI